MRKKYRVALIGCGKVGVLYEKDRGRPAPKSHAKAAASNQRTQLTALVDPDAASRGAAHKLFPKARLYGSARECLVKEKPDIVIIAAPTRYHLPLIRLATLQRVPMIVCEKPLCQNAKEAAAVVRALRGSKSVFVLNYQRRFFPLMEHVRRDIKRGTLGRIQQVTCYYDNGLFNNAGHRLDALMFLLGDRVRSVSAVYNTADALAPKGDPNIDATLEFRSGTRAVLQSFDKRAYNIFELHLFGTKGSISIRQHGFAVEWRRLSGGVTPTFKTVRRAHKRESFVEGALEDVIRCYERGGKPKSGLQSGVDCIAVLEATVASAKRNGKLVRLRYS